MGKIDELIKKLCPSGIKYKKLEEVCNFVQGFAFKNDTFQNEGIGVVRTTNIQDKYISEENMVFINPDNYKEQLDKYIIKKNRILIGMSGTIKVGINTNDKEYYLNQRVGMFIPNEELINNKFLFYILDNSIPQFYDLVSGSSVKNLSSKSINNFRVAVPPLEVQCEIVHILDDFTLLSAELSAELKARQKQYKEYINILLNKNNLQNCKNIKLKDLFDFKNGLSKGKEFFGKGTPFVRYTDVYNNSFLYGEDIKEKVNCTEKELNSLKVRRGDVFFTRTSEIAEEVGHASVMLDEIDNCVFNGFTIKASPKTDLLLPEYCAFCFSTDEFRQYVSTRCAFTTRASLTGKTIGEYELNVPPIKQQKRIVNQLMSLYKLCNDISEGLPAEIEARKKQYEYYRDKLLDFKELKVEE